MTRILFFNNVVIPAVCRNPLEKHILGNRFLTLFGMAAAFRWEIAGQARNDEKNPVHLENLAEIVVQTILCVLCVKTLASLR